MKAFADFGSDSAPDHGLDIEITIRTPSNITDSCRSASSAQKISAAVVNHDAHGRGAALHAKRVALQEPLRHGASCAVFP